MEDPENSETSHRLNRAPADERGGYNALHDWFG
jgi:hypothetical protein